MTSNRPVIVSGASSGIGAATVARLRAAGWSVLAGARRSEKLAELAGDTGCWIHPLDVTDETSVSEFFAYGRSLGVTFGALINNAGVALGMEAVIDADEQDWREMYEVNVLGALRMTQAFIGQLDDRKGDIVSIGSIAGLETYEHGGGYVASKHAFHAMAEMLRYELVGKPIRISVIAPGLTRSEFLSTRFRGDMTKVAKALDGVPNPLTPQDVAETVQWVLSRPPHVNIDLLVIKPLAQASASRMFRETK